MSSWPCGSPSICATILWSVKPGSPNGRHGDCIDCIQPREASAEYSYTFSDAQRQSDTAAAGGCKYLGRTIDPCDGISNTTGTRSRSTRAYYHIHCIAELLKKGPCCPTRPNNNGSLSPDLQPPTMLSRSPPRHGAPSTADFSPSGSQFRRHRQAHRRRPHSPGPEPDEEERQAEVRPRQTRDKCQRAVHGQAVALADVLAQGGQGALSSLELAAQVQEINRNAGWYKRMCFLYVLLVCGSLSYAELSSKILGCILVLKKCCERIFDTVSFFFNVWFCNFFIEQ
jgi:hypothetical protein